MKTKISGIHDVIMFGLHLDKVLCKLSLLTIIYTIVAVELYIVHLHMHYS